MLLADGNRDSADVSKHTALSGPHSHKEAPAPHMGGVW
jgi:hypothetical protein